MKQKQTLLSYFFPDAIPPTKTKKKVEERTIKRKWLQTTLLYFFPDITTCIRPIPRYYIIEEGKRKFRIPENQKGTLPQLFSQNDLKFWNQLHKQIYPSSRGRPPISLKKIFKMLVVGVKYNCRNLKDIINKIKDNPKLARLCGFKSNDVPDRTTLSKILTRIGPEPFKEFHNNLVHEAHNLNIINLKVVIGDTTFLKTNCSGKPIKIKLNEKEFSRFPFTVPKNAEVFRIERFSDPDAGWHIRHNRIYGVGLSHFTIVDSEEELTVFYDLFNGSVHDSKICVPAFFDYFKYTPRIPDGVSLDNGFKSPANNEFFQRKGIKIGIMARSNEKDTVQTSTGKHYQEKYVKNICKEDLNYFAKKRTAVERDYSRGKGSNGMGETTFRGLFKGLIHVGIRHISEVMTALAAKKSGRIWLRRCPTAFSTLR